MKRLFFTFLLISLMGNTGASQATPTIMHLGTVPQVEVSHLEDLNLMQLDPRAVNVTYASNESICIYASAAAHNYGITIDSNNSNRYELRNGNHVLPVELWWSAEAAPENGQLLTPNQELQVKNGSGSTAASCPNGSNANLQIRINSNQLQGLSDGSYSATFDVIVTVTT
jgi:hypothetical protein